MDSLSISFQPPSLEEIKDVAIDLIKKSVYPKLSRYGSSEKSVSVLVHPFPQFMFNAVFKSAKGYVLINTRSIAESVPKRH
jgi:hypothetical protein